MKTCVCLDISQKYSNLFVLFWSGLNNFISYYTYIRVCKLLSLLMFRRTFFYFCVFFYLITIDKLCLTLFLAYGIFMFDLEEFNPTGRVSDPRSIHFYLSFFLMFSINIQDKKKRTIGIIDRPKMMKESGNKNNDNNKSFLWMAFYYYYWS